MKRKITSDEIYSHPNYDVVFEEVKNEPGYSTGSEEEYDKIIDEVGRRLFKEAQAKTNTNELDVEQ